VLRVTKRPVAVQRHLGVEAEHRPSAVFASGFTSTSVASSATNARHKFTCDVDDLLGDVRRERGLGHNRAGGGLIDTLRRIDGTLATLSGCSWATCSISMTAGDAGDAEKGPVGPVEQVREVVLVGDVAASVIITLWTVWPLISMPRMSVARAVASSTVSASFTRRPCHGHRPLLGL
jgi:hypothetical protein